MIKSGGTRPQRWIIWDGEGHPEGRDSSVVYWCRNEAVDGLNLQQYVEDNEVSLRTEFLKTIYDIGEISIRDRSLVDWLVLDDGDVSVWWSGLICEQNYAKCPELNDIIKFLALKKFIVANNINDIVLVSSNRLLSKTIKIYCGQEQIQFTYHKTASNGSINRPVRAGSIKGRTYQRLPHLAQGVIQLARSIIHRWHLRQSRVDSWHSGKNTVFLLSYFLISDSDELTESEIMKKYWGKLPVLLRSMGLKTNWVDIYLSTDSLPSATQANQRMERLRHDVEESTGQGSHNFLFSYLSLAVIGRVTTRYLRLVLMWVRLGILGQGPLRRSNCSEVWPLLARQWRESLIGSTAVTNLLMAELFREVLSEIPHQRLGLYLYEGKGWEWPFVSAWRRNGHGRLIGVAHAVTRFWFLPYFHDARALKGEGANSLPQPELIAVNGPMARRAHMEGGWPEEMLVECEALRYSHLDEIRSEESLRAPQAENLRVLVLGEIETDKTNQILEMLESLPTLAANVVKYWLKPHPAATQSDLYRIDRTSVLNDQLSDLINDFDIVVAGTSGATLEAVLLGGRVVVVVPPSDLNFSPLRGSASVKFASSTQELRDAINSFRVASPVRYKAQDFFYLNDDLPLWQRVVEVGAPQNT